MKGSTIAFIFGIVLKNNIHIFVFALLLLFILVYLIKLKILIKTYKIINLKKNIFFCSFYLLFFFLFFFILRIFRQAINLKDLYNFLVEGYKHIQTLPITEKLIYYYIFLFVICVWILIFIKLYKICCYEWIKLHLYLYYKYMEKYQDIIDNLKLNFTIIGLSNNIYMYILAPILINVYRKYPYKFINIYGKYITNAPFKVLFFLHYIVLFSCLYYDLMYNYYILEITTIYLPIFMLYVLWVRVSNFLQDQSPSLNKAIVEQYYSTNIIYVNLTEEHDILIKLYLKTFKINDYYESHMRFSGPIIILHRYVFIEGKFLDDNCDTYYNANLQIGFDAKNLKKINNKNFIEKKFLYTMYFGE